MNLIQKMQNLFDNYKTFVRVIKEEQINEELPQVHELEELIMKNDHFPQIHLRIQCNVH